MGRYLDFGGLPRTRTGKNLGSKPSSCANLHMSAAQSIKYWWQNQLHTVVTAPLAQIYLKSRQNDSSSISSSCAVIPRLAAARGSNGSNISHSNGITSVGGKPSSSSSPDVLYIITAQSTRMIYLVYQHCTLCSNSDCSTFRLLLQCFSTLRADAVDHRKDRRATMAHLLFTFRLATPTNSICADVMGFVPPPFLGPRQTMGSDFLLARI